MRRLHLHEVDEGALDARLELVEAVEVVVMDMSVAGAPALLVDGAVEGSFDVVESAAGGVEAPLGGARSGSAPWSLARRVAKAAVSAALGEWSPRASSSSWISWRRVENTWQSSGLMPTISAAPLWTGPHSMPSRRVSSWRRCAL